MNTYHATTRPDRDLFRSHRRAGLGAARRPMRRSAACAPAVRAGREQHARDAAVVAARRLARHARARCRLRHRRACGGGRAARRRGAGDRPVAHAGEPGTRTPAAIRRRRHRSTSAPATCSTPRWAAFDYVVGMDSLIHYETGDAVRVLGRPGATHAHRACSSPSCRATRRWRRCAPSASCSRAATAHRPSCRWPRRRLRALLDDGRATAGLGCAAHRARRQRLLHLAGAAS